MQVRSWIIPYGQIPSDPKVQIATETILIPIYSGIIVRYNREKIEEWNNFLQASAGDFKKKHIC